MKVVNGVMYLEEGEHHPKRTKKPKRAYIGNLKEMMAFRDVWSSKANQRYNHGHKRKKK